MAQARLIEFEIDSAIWRGPQANIAWGLRFLPPAILDSYGLGFAPGNLPNSPALHGTAFQMSLNPALLYETLTPAAGHPFYIDLTAYTPPNNGRFPGDPVGGLGMFHDMRVPWRGFNPWDSLNIPVQGAGFYGFFASVLQKTMVNIPVPNPFEQQGVANAENFLINFTGLGPLYWRVGGALIVEIQRSTDVQAPKEVFEVWSSGPDEMLQGISGDPDLSGTSTGLRIPTRATSSITSRYLFMLCGFTLGENERATIRGWRQLATLGSLGVAPS